MKIGIVGSRTFNNYDLLKETLNHYLKFKPIIVSGGSKGADKLGEKFAIENELDTIIIKPDWNKYGKSAGLIRNTDIVKSSDLIIAFWDGESKGTLDSINKSEIFKTPIIVIKFKEE